MVLVCLAALLPCNLVIISEPSLDAHMPQAVAFIMELQTCSSHCLVAELTRANWAEMPRFEGESKQAALCLAACTGTRAGLSFSHVRISIFLLGFIFPQ